MFYGVKTYHNIYLPTKEKDFFACFGSPQDTYTTAGAALAREDVGLR